MSVPWFVGEEPLDDPMQEPRFFKSERGQRVHVQKCWTLPSIYRGSTSRTAAVLAGMRRFKAMCGKTFREMEAYTLSSFADDDLCPGCVNAVPKELQPRLFEHPVE